MILYSAPVVVHAVIWPLCAVGTCTCKSDLEEVGRSIVSSCVRTMVSSVAEKVGRKV